MGCWDKVSRSQGLGGVWGFGGLGWGFGALGLCLNDPLKTRIVMLNTLGLNEAPKVRGRCAARGDYRSTGYMTPIVGLIRLLNLGILPLGFRAYRFVRAPP